MFSSSASFSTSRTFSTRILWVLFMVLMMCQISRANDEVDTSAPSVSAAPSVSSAPSMMPSISAAPSFSLAPSVSSAPSSEEDASNPSPATSPSPSAPTPNTPDGIESRGFSPSVVGGQVVAFLGTVAAFLFF